MKSYFLILLAVLVAYAPTVALALPPRLYFRRPTASTGLNVNHAMFSGSQYLRASSASPTGLTDGRTGTIAFWMKANADGVSYRVLAISNGSSIRFAAAKGSTNVIAIQAWDGSGTLIMDIRSTNTVSAAQGWFHVMACWDLTNTSLRKIYINGASETVNAVTYTNTDIDYLSASPRITVGADSNDTALNNLNGGLAELWFNDSYNDAPSDYYSAGKAVALGATGQLPIGSDPVFYFSAAGTGAAWTTNSGTGGALTINTGSLTTDASPPQFP